MNLFKLNLAVKDAFPNANLQVQFSNYGWTKSIQKFKTPNWAFEDQMRTYVRVFLFLTIKTYIRRQIIGSKSNFRKDVVDQTRRVVSIMYGFKINENRRTVTKNLQIYDQLILNSSFLYKVVLLSVDVSASYLSNFVSYRERIRQQDEIPDIWSIRLFRSLFISVFSGQISVSATCIPLRSNPSLCQL